MILSNLAFHRRLSRISGNPFVYKSLEIRTSRPSRLGTSRGWTPHGCRRPFGEHRRIVAALARRSAAAYEQAIVTHLAGGKGDYQRIFPVGGDGRTAERNSSDRGPRTRGAARRKEGSHA